MPHPTRLLILLLFAGCTPSTTTPGGGPPYAPEEALTTFEIEDGFRIELVAAEPLVMDPVAMDIDEHGRIFVVEMPGYPLDTGGSGRVKLLKDTDDDGQPDDATVFADGLTLPTGIMRWKNGVLVTDPPDVLYLEDTDGDDRADLREVILTGFALSNPQHNANKPLYGLDNWIYLANNGTIWWTEKYADPFGDRGNEIHYPDQPDSPRLPRNGADRNVRFRPETHALETLSGDSQFGHTFDAWGHHFLVDNSHHHYHEVIAARYFQRNPDLPVRRATHDTPDHGNAAAVFPITVNPEHQLLTDRGIFTSACAITYYLGGVFPPPYDQHVTFTAEPVHNLVHVDKVTADGPTFKASRLREDREFLASTDSWFRPVNFSIGPDGALYLVDYYRQIVEHPEWMDDETAQSDRLQNGSDRGRIYRIVPDDAGPLLWYNVLNLGDEETTTLVSFLDNPNVWWRLTTQRLLVDRQDEAAVEPLVRLFRESASAETRVHALWTLDGLGRLDPTLLKDALQDDEPGVRENAILLTEVYLTDAPALADALLALEDDPHPRVRFQLLNTLGEIDTDAAVAARRRLLAKDIEDEWMQIAALLALPDDHAGLFETTLAQLKDRETEGRATYLGRIATIVGAGDDREAVRGLIGSVTTDTVPGSAWWRAAALKGLAEGLRRHGSPPDDFDAERERLLNAFFDTNDPAVRSAVLDLCEYVGLPSGSASEAGLERAAALAADRTADAEARAGAIRLIALLNAEDYLDLLQKTVDPQEPATVQRAAVRALSRTGGTAPATFLLDAWNTLTPEIRTEAVDVFLTEERITLLLEAVENKTVQPATIGWQRRVILMRDTEEPIRSRARALLSVDDAAREALVEQYQAALTLSADAARGEAVFIRACALCHQAGAVGSASFGPDLATVQHWPRQALIAEILNPNRSITDGYEFWTVTRRSGGSLSGIIADETPTSITVRNQTEETTIPRTDIASITASTASAMPAGLEAQIDEQQMADLLAFLKGE